MIMNLLKKNIFCLKFNIKIGLIYNSPFWHPLFIAWCHDIKFGLTSTFAIDITFWNKTFCHHRPITSLLRLYCTLCIKFSFFILKKLALILHRCKFSCNCLSVYHKFCTLFFFLRIFFMFCCFIIDKGYWLWHWYRKLWDLFHKMRNFFKSHLSM